MTKKSTETRAKVFNLRIREEIRVLIDRAAKVRGKTRSDFVIDVVCRAAEDTLLDQTLVQVDKESYQNLLAVLDQPPSGEGFARLLNAPRPWRR